MDRRDLDDTIEKTLAPWKEGYDKPRQSIKKQRHHVADKSLYSQSYGFSSSQVWLWELGKKRSECQRIDAFKLWCYKRLLSHPWTARSNQWILKEISPEQWLEGLKLQYFGHLMQRADSLEKTLMLGKTEGRKRRGWQRMRWLDGFIASTDMNLSKLQEIVKDSKAWHASVHGVTKSWRQLNHWTTQKDGAKAPWRMRGSVSGLKQCQQCWGEILLQPEGCYHTWKKGKGCLGLCIFSTTACDCIMTLKEFNKSLIEWMERKS